MCSSVELNKIYNMHSSPPPIFRTYKPENVCPSNINVSIPTRQEPLLPPFAFSVVLTAPKNLVTMKNGPLMTVSLPVISPRFFRVKACQDFFPW